jgi:hypothetical protein
MQHFDLATLRRRLRTIEGCLRDCDNDIDRAWEQQDWSQLIWLIEERTIWTEKIARLQNALKAHAVAK